MQPMLSQSSSSIAPDENIEYPILVLTQQPDSHHFNERRIVLNDTIKVGRSVARARPCESNAIFDCKVLSRNHAIFWFDNGKVLLKDTKSSNGTFVNSQLLSKGTEDSAPREIYSGDIIQFGVEVVENTTKHGCIIAQTTIYLSDGNELRRHSDMGDAPSGNIPISNYYEEQIYQLAQYIQEASHREQTLEKKLNSLSQLIIDTQEASDSSWKVILNQDRLMEKLELLQEQVDMHAKGDDHDSLTVELQRVLEQRYGMERESKNMLESLMEEKADVLQRVVDLEQSLSSSEEECAQLRTALESLQSEHGQISERLSSGKDEVDGLQRKLEEAQSEYGKEIGRLCQDKESLVLRYEQLCIEADDLRGRLDEAETEVLRGRDQVTTTTTEDDNRHRTVLRALLDQFSERQSNLDSEMAGLESQLCKALLREIVTLQNLGHLEESMVDNEADIESFIVGTTSELGLHFLESQRQIKNGLELIALLREEVRRLQGLVLEQSDDDTGPGHRRTTTTTMARSNHSDNSSVTTMAETSLRDMEALIDKMAQCQSTVRSLVAHLPERLLVHASETALAASNDLVVVPEDDGRLIGHQQEGCVQTEEDVRGVCSACVQTEMDTEIEAVQVPVSVTLVDSASQHTTRTDSLSVQVDLPDETRTSALASLDQCLDSLRTERAITEALKVDLLQLQDDKRQLERKSSELSATITELRQDASMVRQDTETRRDSVQRIASEGYSYLYQESQELRKRVQEIEEEMAQKREDYDKLYEQYETLIAANQTTSASLVVQEDATDKMRELEDLCLRQRQEMDEMRDSMASNYQTIVTRARKISALSVVPLCVLLFGIIVSIISLLARPWLVARETHG